MESLFRTLARAGIRRGSLDLAWDFTVASAHTLAWRMLAIRDDAFATLGDRKLADLRVHGRPPAFHVARVQDFTPAQNADVRRRVTGTVEVPCYLDQPGCPPGARFALDARGRPTRIPGNVQQARFICDIPRSATTAHPGRISLYGHGLFGTAEEVDSVARGDLARTNGVVLCATDWSGMSAMDLPNTFGVLQDLSGFPELADRLQQGFLDFLFLGRALVHPGGFAANPAFQDGGAPLIDTRRLFFAGGSQGGILGGAVSAVAPDWTRAALIVPGMTYSTLLTRSVDFDEFSALLYPSYPNELERPLILSLIQSLWDRGDPDGYAQHLTRDPYRNTPRHDVLLHMAFGDHQVANVTTQVEAGPSGHACGRRHSTPAAAPTCSPSGGSRGCGAGSRRAAAPSSCGTSARCGRRAAAPPARRPAWGRRRRRSATRRRGWAATRTASPAATRSPSSSSRPSWPWAAASSTCAGRSRATPAGGRDRRHEARGAPGRGRAGGARSPSRPRRARAPAPGRGAIRSGRGSTASSRGRTTTSRGRTRPRPPAGAWR